MRYVTLLAALLLWSAWAYGQPAPAIIGAGDIAHSIVVDFGDQAPTPGDQFEVQRDGQCLATCKVYRIQPHRVTLVMLGGGSAGLTYTPQSGDAVVPSSHPVAERVRQPRTPAPMAPLTQRPMTPQYGVYKQQAMAILSVLGTLKNALPDTALNNNGGQIFSAMVDRYSPYHEALERVLPNIQRFNAGPWDGSLYSLQRIRATEDDMDQMDHLWSDYVDQASQRQHWVELASQMELQQDVDDCNAKAGECESAMSGDIESMRNRVDQLKADWDYAQEALDKNN
jgi:hypothetical protein